MAIFKLARKQMVMGLEAPPRLVKAENAKAVRALLLSEFEISEAEAEEAHRLGEQGVKIEDATHL